MAGNAWCLHDDLTNARLLYPTAPVVAVNGAAAHVKALALFSKHPARFMPARWIEKQRRFHDDFTVHGAVHEDGVPWVQHWWEDARGGGSSAWGARKLAWLMGFDPVILCGAPLEVGGYSGYEMHSALMQSPTIIQDFRDQLKAETEWHEGALSMSGWTADFLGSPCL